MKEKMHITVLSLGICTLIGMTFAVSVRDYKEKTPKLNSASEATTSSKKFECTKEAVSETSPATKEYKKNQEKLSQLTEKFGDLGGNTSTLNDPCEGFKGKEKTECNINNVELRGVLRQIQKLGEKILPYLDCLQQLQDGKIISGEVTTKKEKNTPTWHEGKWSTCTDGKQKRTVECQSDGKKVEDTKCEGKKPITYQKCTDTPSSKNTPTTDFELRKVAPWSEFNPNSFNADKYSFGIEFCVHGALSMKDLEKTIPGLEYGLPWSYTIIGKNGDSVVYDLYGAFGGWAQEMKNGQCTPIAIDIQPDDKAFFDTAKKVIFTIDHTNLVKEKNETNNKKELLISK